MTDIPSVKDARTLPKVVPNAKIITNQAAQGQKAPEVNSSVPSGKNNSVDLSRETKSPDVVVNGSLGHELVIRDQIEERSQFYRYLITCKCNWQSRVHTFEQAKHSADNHIYQNTKPRLK